MSRETTFLLALGLLIAAAAVVSASGWILFARDRREHRAALAGGADSAPTGGDASPDTPPHHAEAVEER